MSLKSSSSSSFHSCSGVPVLSLSPFGGSFFDVEIDFAFLVAGGTSFTFLSRRFATFDEDEVVASIELSSMDRFVPFVALMGGFAILGGEKGE